MRCENCKSYLRLEDKEQRTVTHQCSATPRKRKLGTTYISIVAYSSKIFYAPKWCPKSNEHKLKAIGEK